VEFLVRLEFGIAFRHRQQSLERARELIFRLRSIRRRGRLDRLGAIFCNILKRTFFMESIAFHGLDQIGNQIVAAFELYVNVGPRRVRAHSQADQAVVHPHKHEADHDDKAQDDPAHHFSVFLSPQ
jgi:hypothetical protein